MTDDHKKPFWPWIVALLIGLPVLYVASFGPACWITSRANRCASVIGTVYKPMTWAMSSDDETLWRLITWYAEIGAPINWHWKRTLYLNRKFDGTRSERSSEWSWEPDVPTPTVYPPPWESYFSDTGPP